MSAVPREHTRKPASTKGDIMATQDVGPNEFQTWLQPQWTIYAGVIAGLVFGIAIGFALISLVPKGTVPGSALLMAPAFLCLGLGIFIGLGTAHYVAEPDVLKITERKAWPLALLARNRESVVKWSEITDVKNEAVRRGRRNRDRSMLATITAADGRKWSFEAGMMKGILSKPDQFEAFVTLLQDHVKPRIVAPA